MNRWTTNSFRWHGRRLAGIGLPLCLVSLLAVGGLLFAPAAALVAQEVVAEADEPSDEPSDAPSDASTKKSSDDSARPTLLVVVGAGGTDEYAAGFGEWADRWQQAARHGGADHLEIGREERESSETDREQLQAKIAEHAGPSDAPLWLVLLGHGTFYRDVARFNLRGPDVSADDLNAWLKTLQRPLIVVNCASSSGPFLSKLAAPNRVVITATRNGAEQNFARFGGYLSAALLNPSADLDHDDQVSLLEAYLLASAEVERFYASESRLSTEHALLDDNGDGLGTPATFFRGARAVRAARDGAPLDGQLARRQTLLGGTRQRLTAEQRAQRDALEDQIESLRARKSTLAESDYYEQLESLLLPLAQLYKEETRDAPSEKP
jgi:hypothetical protein